MAAAVLNGDLARRSVSALFWMLGGSAGRVVAQLVIQIALARILGPQAFGQFSAVLVVLGIGWLLADSGFGAALIQKKELHDADIAQALGWVLLVATVVAGAVFVLAPVVAAQMADPELNLMLRVGSVLIFLLALSNISSSLLRRQLDEKRLQIIQFAAYVGASGTVSIGLALMGAGAWSLLAGFAAQTLVTLLMCYASVRHTLKPRLVGEASFRTYGLKVLVNNIVNWSIEYLDRFLVGKLWGVVALGLYTVSGNLARAPLGLMVTSFQTIAFSSASRIQHDDPLTRKAYLTVLSAVGLLMLPVFALAAAEARPILDLVYGPKWHAAAPYFAAFSVAMPLYALAAVTGPFLQARNAVEREIVSQIIVVVVLFGGYMVLQDHPLEQAVWIVPAAYLLRYALLMAALKRTLPIPLSGVARALRGGAALAVLALAADWGAQQVLAGAGLPAIAPLAAACLVCALVLRAAGSWLASEELRMALAGRAADSAPVRVACRMLGLSAQGGRAA